MIAAKLTHLSTYTKYIPNINNLYADYDIVAICCLDILVRHGFIICIRKSKCTVKMRDVAKVWN